MPINQRISPNNYGPVILEVGGAAPAKKAPAKKSAKPKQITVDQILPRVITDLELSPDGTDILQFTLLGQPATKKNSQQKTSWGGIIQSKFYLAYEKACKEQCLDAWARKGNIPMDYGVSMNIRVFLKNWQVGDAMGYMQSVADILQKFDVLKDDSWVHWVDNGQHWLGGIDKENPRVEIRIQRYRHPKEEYRAEQVAQEEAKKKRMEERAKKQALKNATSGVIPNE